MPEDLWTLVAGCWAHHEQRITLGAIIDKLKSMEISVEDIVSRWKEQKLWSRMCLELASLKNIIYK